MDLLQEQGFLINYKIEILRSVMHSRIIRSYFLLLKDVQQILGFLWMGYYVVF